MKTNKLYEVTIQLETVKFRIVAKNKTEAKKKAIEKLDRKKPSTLMYRSYPDNRKLIWGEEL